jgi:GNAT superfamily N-acetyltransferase
VPKIEFRPLAEGDCLEALTRLIRAAYAERLVEGLRYWATHQSAEDTARRFANGRGFVAVEGGDAFVGTIVVRPPRPDAEVPLYRDPGTWSFGRFAVAPSHRGRGVGRALHAAALAHAARHGGVTMALDTAAPARGLIALYGSWGYRIVGRHDFRPHVNYESVLMSRPIRDAVAS